MQWKGKLPLCYFIKIPAYKVCMVGTGEIKCLVNPEVSRFVSAIV